MQRPVISTPRTKDAIWTLLQFLAGLLYVAMIVFGFAAAIGIFLRLVLWIVRF